MFNTITLTVLNRFLGDYLDITALDMSLWEGDITLNDVAVKSTAIHAFRLPYHVVAGNVGKLSIKIPWRSIYTSPVEVLLTDVHFVVIPSKMVPYDEEEEEAELLAYKLAHVKYLEDKDKELERQGSIGSAKYGGSSERVPVLTQSLSFSESLAAAILRNLTVRVESVHIRYEDNGPAYQPFSLGIVLSVLTLETTNEKGVRTFIPEETPMIYKLLNLHGFGVYMNTDDNITKHSQSTLSDEAKEEVILKLGSLVKDKKRVGTLDYSKRLIK